MPMQIDLAVSIQSQMEPLFFQQTVQKSGTDEFGYYSKLLNMKHKWKNRMNIRFLIILRLINNSNYFNIKF